LLGGGRDRRRPRGGAQLGEDIRHVSVDRVLTQHERRGDLSVRAALRDEPEDLPLTWTEVCGPAGLTAALKLAGAALLARRAKLEKRSASSLEFRPRRIAAPSARSEQARAARARPASNGSPARASSPTASSNACRAWSWLRAAE
jgi:hypothetical protein